MKVCIYERQSSFRAYLPYKNPKWHLYIHFAATTQMSAVRTAKIGLKMNSNNAG